MDGMKRHGVAEGPEFYDAKYKRYAKSKKHVRPDWDRFRALAEEASKYVVGSVLDLGCGFGFLAEFVRGPYLGVDFSRRAVKRARSRNRNPQASFLQADIREWEPPGKFDTVVFLEVIEHLDDPWQAIGLAHKTAIQRILISVPRDMKGPGHVWPRWTQEDVVKLLGPGSTSWQWRRWLFGFLLRPIETI